MCSSDLADSLSTVPLLAESWKVSDDGTEWTFQLRQGVQFHDGTALSAEDVVFTFERILDPATGSTQSQYIKDVQLIEAVDDFTVRILLNRPDFTLLYKIQEPPFGIIASGRTNDDIASTPIGAGPFTFVEHDPGVSMTFARNQNYWDAELPYLDEVVHQYIPDSAARVAGLTSGTLDALVQVGVENIATFEGNPVLNVVSGNISTYMVFAMRADMEPFNDSRVRKAFKHVVDRAGMVAGVLQGYGEAGNDQPIPPTNSFYAEQPALSQDIDAAKKLLAEAGYADGLTVPLYVAEVGPGVETTAVAFQEMAKEAGITIEIQRRSADTYWVEDYMQQSFFVSFWQYWAEPDFYLSSGYESGAPYNESGWTSPEMDALIQAGRAEPDGAKRQEIYAEIQQILSEEGSVIVPYFQPLHAATTQAVQGYIPELYPQLRATWLRQG